MRLDYTLYFLAVLLLIMAVIPFIMPLEEVESNTRSLWVVITVVLGLLSIGLGYSQRPKTEAQSCRPTTTKAKKMQSPATEVQSEEKAVAPVKDIKSKKEAKKAVPAAAEMTLRQIKGIGEKRAAQLEALGIRNVDDLSKASVKTISDNLNISRKIIKKWIGIAKKLIKQANRNL